MIKYTMSRFRPGHEDHAEEVRTVTAESEDEAYRLIGETIDESYWQITDSQPVELPAYLAGKTGRMFCTCPAGDCVLKIPGVMLGEGHFCRKGTIPNV